MSNKDWTGNKKSIYVTLGASSHTEDDRQKHDYYATEPKAVELLLELEQFNNVLEPACGEGHISKVLEQHKIPVTSYDKYSYGYGQIQDFFGITRWYGDIITNPPYKLAQQFVEHALEIIPEGRKVAMFLKLQFLEGKKRKKMFQKYPPKVVYVSASRLVCAKNGEFTKNVSRAVAYAWFVWVKGFKGEPVIRWFN